MKHIKLLAIITLFFAANALSAQTTNKWKAMDSYGQVITRINNGMEQGNMEAVKAFTETLQNVSDQLAKSEVPAEYNTKAITDAVTGMEVKTAKLHKAVAAKASDDVLKKAVKETYDDYIKVLGLIAEKK